MPRVGSVLDPPYNCRGDGVTDNTAGLNLALATGYAFVPPGIYRTTGTLRMPSHCLLEGVGAASVIKPDATLLPMADFPVQPATFILTNTDYLAGNGGMTVHNIAFDASNINRGSLHHLHFRHTQDVIIDKVRTFAGGDGVAFTASHRFQVLHSFLAAAINSGLDMWDNCYDGLFADCMIDGQGVGNYGVLVTGVGVNGVDTGVTSRIVVSRNILSGILGLGIKLQGGSAASRACDVIVAHNVLSGPMVQGIRGCEADGAVITGNVLEGVQTSIVLAGEVGTPGVNGVILGNLIRDNVGPIAIAVGWLSTGWVVAGNVALGANRTLQLDPGTSGNLIAADNALAVVNYAGGANTVL